MWGDNTEILSFFVSFNEFLYAIILCSCHCVSSEITPFSIFSILSLSLIEALTVCCFSTQICRWFWMCASQQLWQQYQFRQYEFQYIPFKIAIQFALFIFDIFCCISGEKNNSQLIFGGCMYVRACFVCVCVLCWCKSITRLFTACLQLADKNE